jgi:hypothetical protein
MKKQRPLLKGSLGTSMLHEHSTSLIKIIGQGLRNTKTLEPMVNQRPQHINLSLLINGKTAF